MLSALIGDGRADPVVPAGPATQGWVLDVSGLASSLGSAPVRAGFLAAALGALAVARRWRALAYVVAVTSTVHLLERVGKAAIGRARPTDVARGHALAPSVRLAVIVLLLAAGVWLLRRRGWRAAIWVGGAYAIVIALDHLIGLVPVTAGRDALPSGHAANTMAIFAALALVRPRGRFGDVAAVAGLVFVVVVGISRVTLGYHHPFDVLAGWCLALVVALAGHLVIGPGRGDPTGPGQGPPRRALAHDG